MQVNGTPYRSIWLNDNGWCVDIIDQTRLPHEFSIKSLRSMQDAAEAISFMRVRGAPLTGATAAYGLALAMREDASDAPRLRLRANACERANYYTPAQTESAVERAPPSRDSA